MTKQLTFTGYSDDLFIVSIDGQPHEEIDCFNKQAKYRVCSELDQLYIVGEYVLPGVWMIGIAPVEEDIPIPPWDIRVINGHSYSPVLKIACPDNVIVEEEEG